MHLLLLLTDIKSADTAMVDDEVFAPNEVYALKTPSKRYQSSSDEENAGEEEAGSEEETPAARRQRSDAPTPASVEPKGRFSKPDFGQSDGSEGESDDDVGSDEEEERWHPNSYHVSRKSGDALSDEDEEDIELEVQEARRLQRKAREQLSDWRDYGLEEDGELARDAAADALAGKARFHEDEDDADDAAEDDDSVQINEDEAIAWLLANRPEALALVDDLREMSRRRVKVSHMLEDVRGLPNADSHPSLSLLELEHQALSTYVPLVAFYFSLLLAPAVGEREDEALVVQVLERIAGVRKALATMEDLDMTAGNSDDEDEDDLELDDDEELYDEEDDMLALASENFDAPSPVDSEQDDDEGEGEDEDAAEELLAGLTDDEVESVMSSLAPRAGMDELVRAVEQFKAKKMATRKAAKAVNGTSTTTEATKPKRNRRRSRARKTDAEREGLDIPELAPASASSSKPSRTAARVDDYLEPTALETGDASDKARAKHSLRFHVGQARAKENRRERRQAGMLGGDDDVPRRTKEMARQEALKRQRHGHDESESTALDGEDDDGWTEKDRKRAREVRDEEPSDDDYGDAEGYYDLVKASKTDERAAKKARYEQERADERAALEDLTESNPAGARGVTRQIMSNRGLTPKRAKVNRNPRVKKRLRYEKAQKKVASQKAVYDRSKAANASAGRYAGETSGIGKRVVKSTKL